ncbi:MAG: UDP-N-acetyl-D-glucosamine dehydrogenase, partial [Anaerolineae bacterium]|nr:UDP-N-acetyl-D-glucosamine dehydrogenase [Anaerolineae bacterium]
MNPIKDAVIQSLNERTARIGILGLGYVGLPLAAAFVEAGFKVTGIDPDPRKVNTLNQGVSYVQDVASEQIAKHLKLGKLSATTDFSALVDCDAVSICVPTPLRKTGDPDMSFILSATDELARYIHPGMIIVLESTTYPGTTREVLLPKLGKEKGLVVGKDFFLAF